MSHSKLCQFNRMDIISCVHLKLFPFALNTNANAFKIPSVKCSIYSLFRNANLFLQFQFYFSFVFFFRWPQKDTIFSFFFSIPYLCLFMLLLTMSCIQQKILCQKALENFFPRQLFCICAYTQRDTDTGTHIDAYREPTLIEGTAKPNKATWKR